MQIRLLLCVALVALGGFAFGDTDKPCEEIRAGFDIGSSNTKFKVAKVDICRHIILKNLLEKTDKASAKVDFAGSMANSPDKKTIGPEVIALAIRVISEFKETAIGKGAKRFYAVATAGLREAKNGKDVAAEISDGVKFPDHAVIDVISQDEEARLGFRSGSSIYAYSQFLKSGSKDESFFSKKFSQSLVVWDIGGRTSEISFMGENEIQNLDTTGPLALASLTFKKVMLEESKYSVVDPKRTSPNPIGFENAKAGIYIALKKMNVGDEFLKRNLPERTIIGIGGVHASNLALINKSRADGVAVDYYTKEMLSLAIALYQNETDAQLKAEFPESADYADTMVSNLILVLGSMHRLMIDRVQVVKATLAEGLILQE